MGVELAAGKAGLTEMEDVNFTDLEVVRFVRDALTSFTVGDRENYEQLIGVIHHTKNLAPDEVALLVTSLKALSGAVSCFDNVHHELLSAIFGMSMWHYSPDVMDALVELIIALAAASGKYIDSCLDMLVRNFMPPYNFLELLKQPRGLAKKDHVLDRVHSALEDIADLIPLAPLRLKRIVCDKMPHSSNKEPMIVIYAENMLRLERSVMGELVGDMMLAAVVDKLIDLDVEIEWEDILQDDSGKGIFEMELEDVEETLDDDDQEGEQLPREYSSGRSFRGNASAEKLDSMLVLMFEHLKTCAKDGHLAKVFETLLESFQITVLSAYKSKFSQFVMFYACSLDPENCGTRFANILADIFLSSSYPPFKRMSAVAYLASYLSRAKFLSVSFVVKMLQRLVGWCWNYCENQDGTINPEAHRVFYSGCQAIMYVLCFRMRSAMDVPRLKSQLFLMPIEAILKHPLNSLKVCLPSIVEEFLRQAKAARLFMVSETFVFNDMLESELSRAFGGMERLDMFFPFDPCLLKKSDRFIRPNFVFWSMVRTTYDNDDEEGSSEEDVFEDFTGGSGENVVNDAMAASYEDHDIDLDEFDYSMNKMSITPKNSLKYRFGGELRGGAMQMPSRIRPSMSPESL
ncbi:hypothetical protein RHGRI_022558 [Rhododendron griersonianum]|uniref:RNA polymerase I-specific transcription initiation factor RRN3 n=1 Tax=Rhododendron griersonianum TaxID=479676 RepID=A0AAV6J079_9ERIC|nr:hypothetical protein RHGRI_022558 [Rhododendron griersonianum]KAG5534462.1 hypothetical protein RHGRI_022558 [Rhododendron griersonianum]